MEVLASGTAEFRPPDPDGFRAWVREHKNRTLVPKLMTEQEATARFVQDGDYLAYDCNMLQRGPGSLLREIIRQRKRDLWVCGKFTYTDTALLVGAGVAGKVDVGFVMGGGVLTKAVQEGRVRMYEYSNVTLAQRLAAGAAGVPFIAMRFFGGTDGFDNSCAKLVADPYTGQPVTILPALNPDVAIIHVHQADQYGNARVFGTGIAHVECALASRTVILSAEEIIDTEEIRRDPGRTSIPYYAVDAVVHAPFGCYPGEVGGYYASDPAVVMETFIAINDPNAMAAYLDKWVYSVENHQDMLDKRVGVKKLLELRQREFIKEGYSA